jgi:drug/metabolite transporter (DMT)-like permease
MNKFSRHFDLYPIIGVAFTVILQIVAAITLDFAASTYNTISLFLILTIGFVFFLQILRFLLWGIIHKKHDLSRSYPYIAIFFPLIYIIAIINQEASIEINKLLGVSLICIGIFNLHKSS